MTKTPDETKKGLEVCNIWMVDEPNRCRECPYFRTKDCADTLMKHALALIQQLEKRVIHLEALNQSNLTTITMQERTRARLQEQISQLEAERDAAVADIKRMAQDPYDPAYCDYCKKTEEECGSVGCWHRSEFEWRGVQKGGPDPHG